MVMNPVYDTFGDADSRCRIISRARQHVRDPAVSGCFGVPVIIVAGAAKRKQYTTTITHWCCQDRTLDEREK